MHDESSVLESSLLLSRLFAGSGLNPNAENGKCPARPKARQVKAVNWASTGLRWVELVQLDQDLAR
jgi:hypothetical protein